MDKLMCESECSEADRDGKYSNWEYSKLASICSLDWHWAENSALYLPQGKSLLNIISRVSEAWEKLCVWDGKFILALNLPIVFVIFLITDGSL